MEVLVSVVKVDSQCDVLVARGNKVFAEVFCFSGGGAEVVFFGLFGLEQ